MPFPILLVSLPPKKSFSFRREKERLRMPATASWITRRKHPDGTEACIRDTNINVWGLIARHHRGQDNEDILAANQGLTATDLDAAMAYYRENTQEIDEAIRRNLGQRLGRIGEPNR
jgi:uncharacterized protein (DUF433 family)